MVIEVSKECIGYKSTVKQPTVLWTICPVNKGITHLRNVGKKSVILSVVKYGKVTLQHTYTWRHFPSASLQFVFLISY